MNAEEINKKINCCSCGGNMENNRFINLAPVFRKADWQYPTWGNVLQNIEGLACAYLCDKCHEAEIEPSKVVEIDKNQNVIYHEIESLEHSH